MHTSVGASLWTSVIVHTLYLDPETECATMCVMVELISPRTVAPIKWARLHKEDASDLFLKPVKQTTRPSIVQE